MSDINNDHAEPPQRSPIRRWLPWILALVVIAVVVIIARPSSDNDDSEVSGSATAAAPAEPATTGCDERQLTGSDYGPCKAESFTGDNGGATAEGVTADTIKVSFREANPAQLAALKAIAGPAMASLGGDQEATLSDLKSLVAYFNDQFDLYGRTVELDVYEGQGQFLDEFQGKGVQGAQIDAARVSDAGAFADVSLATMTQPYAEALASEKVVLLGPVYLSQDWYSERAPFAYGGAWPVGTQMGEFAGNVTCAQLAGHPAEFASDDLASTERTFGVLHPENPEYAKIADSFEEALSKCDQTVTKDLSYAIDIASAQQDSTNAMAQMKDAGVTTVVCFCDEVFPIFFTPAANQQEYGPGVARATLARPVGPARRPGPVGPFDAPRREPPNHLMRPRSVRWSTPLRTEQVPLRRTRSRWSTSSSWCCSPPCSRPVRI